jgi:hypothetical protein
LPGGIHANARQSGQLQGHRSDQRGELSVQIVDSGRGDLSERHEEIIRDGLNSRSA